MKFKNTFLVALFLPAITTAADRYSYTVENIEYATQDFEYSADSARSVLITLTTDLNGDGATDLIIGTGTNRILEAGDPLPDMILLNNGDNSFTEANSEQFFSDSPRQGQVADFNGDGKPDVFLSNQGFDNEPYPGLKDTLLLSSESGYIDATNRLPDIPAFSHDAASGDIDNDGDIDILVLNNELGNIDESSYLLINDGVGNFAVNRERLPKDLVNPAPVESQFGWAAEFSDLDNDGWQDLIIGRLSVNSQQQPRLPTRIHWNQGDGGFIDSSTTSLPAPQSFFDEQTIEVNEIAVHDFDDDGLMDLLVTSVQTASFSGRGVQILINQGGRSFADETLKRLGSVAIQADVSKRPPYFFEYVDVNQDGYLDILSEFSGDDSDDSPIIWEGTGYGCFNPVTLSEITSNNDAKYALTSGVPVFASGKLSYIEPWVGKDSSDQDVIRINKLVTLAITKNPVVANYFDSCSGYLRTRLNAAEFGFAALDFTIKQTEPTVQIQALATSLKVLDSIPQKAALFDSVNAQLSIPELVVDDAVVYTNLIFNMVDTEQLIFELVSFD